MKRFLKGIVIVMIITLAASLFASCGDESKDNETSSEASVVETEAQTDVLTGTWKTPEDADDDITWVFEGNGKCTFDNTAIKQDGTYKFLDDERVEVKLELWDDAKIYDFKIDGDKMSFIDEAGYASYEVLNKQ